MIRPCLALALLVGLLAGPVAAAAQPPDPFPRVVTDAAGLPVTVTARPAAVAQLGGVPSLDRLIAPADLRPLDPDHPPARWDSIDLLVTSTLVAAAYPGTIEAARAAGVPVFQTGLARTLDDWRSATSALGRVTGRDAAAAALIARLDRRERALAARLAGRTPVSVLVLSPEAYTLGAPTLFSDLIAAAGGVNAAAAAGYDDFRQIDDSALVALAPQVILLTPGWDSAARAALMRVPAYADVPAIRGGRVYRLPWDPTQPTDPAAALLTLAALLHPLALLRPLTLR